MLGTIGEFLSQTPWWVYVIFIYLFIVGKKALHPRVIPFSKMLILPLFFAVWSAYSLYTVFNSPLDIVYWAISIILGAAIGWIMTAPYEIKADKEKFLIWLPGTRSTFVLVMVIFAVKYFFGYLYATDPHAQKNVYIYSIDLITSGFITGMFIGKALCLWSKFKTADHTNLTPTA